MMNYTVVNKTNSGARYYEVEFKCNENLTNEQIEKIGYKEIGFVWQSKAKKLVNGNYYFGGWID